MKNEIKLVSSSGIYIGLDGERLLIDAFIGRSYPPYRVMPRDMYQGIMAGPAVSALLYTHHHPDHCCEFETAAYVAAHPGSKVVAGPEAAERLLGAGVPAANLVQLGPGPQHVAVGSLSITAFTTRHLGLEYRHKQHYSFLVEGSRRLVFAGDATPVYSNFMPGGAPIGALDVLVATYPFVTGNPAMKLFEVAIAPKKVFVVHLPDREMDTVGEYQMLADAVREGRRFKTIIPEQPGDGMEL